MSFEFYTEPRLTMGELTARDLPGVLRRAPRCGARYGTMTDGVFTPVEQYVFEDEDHNAVWAFVETREPNAPYPRLRPGTVVFESFGNNRATQILEVVQRVFGVVAYNEYGHTIEEEKLFETKAAAERAARGKS